MKKKRQIYGRYENCICPSSGYLGKGLELLEQLISDNSKDKQYFFKIILCNSKYFNNHKTIINNMKHQKNLTPQPLSPKIIKQDPIDWCWDGT